MFRIRLPSSIRAGDFTGSVNLRRTGLFPQRHGIFRGDTAAGENLDASICLLHKLFQHIRTFHSGRFAT